MPDGTVGGDRRVCRSDFEHAYIYDSGAGGEQDTITGTTMFSLSRDAYRELKARGETRHRNVSFYEGAMARSHEARVEDVREDLELALVSSNGRRAMVEHARALGCSEAWVLTDEANDAANALYRSVGGGNPAPQLMYDYLME